jgi:hypothetical protein
LYIKIKIIANKQNAAQSGVEQPADLAPVFKINQKHPKDTYSKGHTI